MHSLSRLNASRLPAIETAVPENGVCGNFDALWGSERPNLPKCRLCRNNVAFRNDCCEVDLVAIRFRQWKGRYGTDLFGKTLAIHGSTASHDGHCGFLCRFCNDSWNPAISLVSPSARALACADLHPCLCLCPLHGGDALHPRTEEAERALIASKPGVPLVAPLPPTMTGPPPVFSKCKIPKNGVCGNFDFPDQIARAKFSKTRLCGKCGSVLRR